jgi:hypothetical protein
MQIPKYAENLPFGYHAAGPDMKPLMLRFDMVATVLRMNVSETMQSCPRWTSMHGVRRQSPNGRLVATRKE